MPGRKFKFLKGEAYAYEKTEKSDFVLPEQVEIDGVKWKVLDGKKYDDIIVYVVENNETVTKVSLKVEEKEEEGNGNTS